MTIRQLIGGWQIPLWQLFHRQVIPATPPDAFRKHPRDCHRRETARYISVEGWRLGWCNGRGRGDFVTQHLGSVAIVVRDYDEAIDWYCEVLGFSLIEDTRLSDTKRWVLVAPAGSPETSLLLARAATPDQSSRIGNQTGGRVFLFLNTDDFWRDFKALSAKGVVFRRPPAEETYGTVAVFEDLYGNLWDLIQPRISVPRAHPG